jgi:uncharacterized protein (TIGR02680 family)
MTVTPLPHTDAPALQGPAHRWRPHRAGAVQVWQYADEVVEFASGRLLLFGPNGSGKTMLLELTLPYLLDAKGQPGRLSTSGADRGGLWDRVTGYASGEGRTGYLWVQFTRTTAGGAVEHFTIGARLRARPGGGGESCWFTTTRQPGVDLHLLDGQRRPLDVLALTDAIGERGTVWNRDTDGYREAVRATLFAGFTAGQLEALISTLLIVRKQSVTEGLSPGALNELLTEGLPALDEQQVTKVANGFEDLDARRDQIAEMEDDAAAVAALDDTVRRYARAVVQRHADAVRSAETQRDDVTRSERLASLAEADARAVADRLEVEEDEREARQETVRGEIDGKKRSAAYAGLGELRSAEQAAASAAAAAAAAAERVRRSEAERDRVADRHRAAAESAEEAANQRAAAAAELRGLSVTAGIGAAVADVDDDQLAERVIGPLAARDTEVRTMRTAVEAHGRAVTARDAAEEQVEQAALRLARANDGLETARAAARAELTAWQAGLTDWLGRLVELDHAALGDLARLDEPQDARQQVAEALAVVREQLAASRQEVAAEQQDLVAEATELRGERDGLAAGNIPLPEAPAWRSSREGRDGAPLWASVDFADHVGDDDRAGLEAALLAGGLLDAFVSADGTVALPDGAADVTLTTTGGLPAGVHTLADVLVPEAGSAVPAEVVGAVLANVAVVPAAAHAGVEPVAVAVDGSFRLGTLTGRGAAQPARFIGATAQAQARARRIAAIDQRLAAIEARQRVLASRLAAYDQRGRAAAAELAALPDSRRLNEARGALREASGAAGEAERNLRERDADLTAAEDAVRESLVALNLLHARTNLPTSADGLDVIAGALASAKTAAGTCAERSRRLTDLTARCDDSGADLRRWQQTVASDEQTLHQLRGEARRLAGEHEGLRSSVGKAADQVRAELATLEREDRELTDRLKVLQEERRKAAGAQAQALGTLQQAVAARQAADAHREGTRVALAALVGSTLYADAAVDVDVPAGLSWTAALQLARDLRDPLARVDSSLAALARLRRAAGERFHAATQQLAGRFDLVFVEHPDHPWEFVIARDDGRDLGCAQLRQVVEDRLGGARAELSASEQRVFEQTLTGAVRAHLADRIRTAGALVKGMNTVLARVETAAGGVRTELRWDVDGDIADTTTLKRIRELLLSGHHSPTEAAQLHQFLREQIERVRADDGGTASWYQRLTRILDYRRWHRFTVLVHHDRFGDAPVRFGSKKVTLSAGEKTVALTLPLIAAVAAHYMPRGEGDVPACPRLLLMDELFPKVDRPNKRQLLGLLPRLDLDAVFTSDKDWCNYDTLDEIAIHVMQKDDADRSYTTRFVWRGTVRSQVAAPAAVVSSGPEPDGLLRAGA